MLEIAERANESTTEFGIEVVDVRIKAIELPDDVRESVSSAAWLPTGKKKPTCIASGAVKKPNAFVLTLTARYKSCLPKPNVTARR